jgi:hypothetical protein
VNLILYGTLLIRIIIGTHFFSASDLPYSNLFGFGVISGEINDLSLSEASGIASSRNLPGMYWVINDSGNAPKLFLINDKGEMVMSYLISGVNNIDWEDIAVFTNAATGDSEIYIADIGDNMALREHVSVIKIKEPANINAADTIIEDHKIYHFKYEDGPRDAEALLIDPATEDLYIISKREKNVRVYHAPPPASESDTSTLIFQVSLPFHNITAADISPDGTEILLKNYDAVFYWEKDAEETIPEVLTKEHQLLFYKPEPQGESITWSLDNSGYYTISERNYPKKQYLYFYKRNN